MRHFTKEEICQLFGITPDMLGLMESSADILEKGRTIANHKFIESWDGTRIMGVDRENPRVEIEVRGINQKQGGNTDGR